MAERMLKFVTVPQQRARQARGRRAPRRLRRDLRLVRSRARRRAGEPLQPVRRARSARCIARCSNNIPDWLKLTAEGRLEEAYELAAATNNFPEICGRICPQDRLCEGNCVIEQAAIETVTIGAVEQYITDTAWEHGWVKPAAPARRERRIGRHHRRRPGRARRRRAAAPPRLRRCTSTTATTASAAC